MKKIVIGIDISKEKIDASAIDVRDSQLGVVKMGYQVFDNRPMGFRRMLVWARHLVKGIELEDVLFCCETTGGYDRSLCDYIYAKGLDIWREGALQIKRSMGVRKGKDDKADSLMIAEYAMRHMDKAVMYESPSDSIRELKALFLYRHKLVQEKVEKKVRAKHLKETSARSKSMRFIVRDAMKGIRALEKSIRECERQIREIINGDEELKRSYDHIVSVKGISIVNATALIAYSNNFRGITTANKMASYYGVASFRDRSGTSVDKKSYVKYYSCSLLRATITQAAEWTIKENGIYRDYYLRLKAEGKPYGIIINNVKNKLIHLVFSLVTNNMDYEQNHEFLRAKRRDEQKMLAPLVNIN
ncbi:MAG: transposase [Prevotella sp.]|nr:transposase [Prevotella sp.]